MKISKEDYLAEKIKDEKEDAHDNPDFKATISEFNEKLFFEEHVTQQGNRFINSKDHQIQKIDIEGEIGFEWITLYFGEFGHIHLKMNELEAFKESLDWVYNNMKKIDEETCEFKESADGTRVCKRKKDNVWLKYKEEDGSYPFS